MRRVSTLTALLLLPTSAAFAGPVEVPTPPPPVYVEPERCAQPFECFYVGIEYGHSMITGFEQEEGDPEEAFDLDNGSVFGAFAGYNFQNGNLVYGGEVRFLHLDLEDPATGFTMDSVIDARARLGFAASDNILLYGALGYSFGDGDGGLGGPVDMSGVNYGVGAEYNLTETFFLGLDYTGRQLEGSTAGFDYEADVNTLTVRAGLRF